MSRRWQDTWEDFALWLGLLGFAVEVPFGGLSGRRRWRWDFFRYPVAVEYQGRHGSRDHTSLKGTRRDYEKANEGQLCGLVVIQCCAETIRSGECQAWIEAALKGITP